jgi:hypothetical protein
MMLSRHFKSQKSQYSSTANFTYFQHLISKFIEEFLEEEIALLLAKFNEPTHCYKGHKINSSFDVSLKSCESNSLWQNIN